jgi:hypothetical protein
VEGVVCDALVHRGSAVKEVTFTAVDPLQRVAGAIESQEFELEYLGEQEQPLLLPCPDASVGMHGGRRTLVV